MKKEPDRVYDVDGKLVYLRRSNVGLDTDIMFPGPGWGVPRAMTLTRVLVGEWPEQIEAP